MSRMNHLHLPDQALAVHISARHTELPDYIAEHVRDRLAKAQRFGIVFDRIEVLLHGERNPRNASSARRVEITGHSPGIVVRAEFAAADWLTAFDFCLDRWHERVRRTSERRAARRRGRYGHSVEITTATLTADGEGTPPTAAPVVSSVRDVVEGAGLDVRVGPFVVREKTHHGPDLSVDEAIDAMEMVGHDFYAFIERGSGQFCVVYQRKAFTYGLLRIEAPST